MSSLNDTFDDDPELAFALEQSMFQDSRPSSIPSSTSYGQIPPLIRLPPPVSQIPPLTQPKPICPAISVPKPSSEWSLKQAETPLVFKQPKPICPPISAPNHSTGLTLKEPQETTNGPSIIPSFDPFPVTPGVFKSTQNIEGPYKTVIKHGVIVRVPLKTPSMNPNRKTGIHTANDFN